ncbi:helix-turn-helix domain-containing protein [Allorhizocola rhizosphaerae]|uniref:helix-turn-helix domain-containing protein n=1 Tax=Allorhizocola rhizosphaerae TaxID=1872709 RepID=UPI000E3B74D9|nr:helix-turn-helix transcriptional regulator [Allorhizocola rhizosphaerae]
MSTQAKGPTVARRRLRIALRAAREKAGLTQEQAAELLEWSLSKVIRIEAGTVGISSTDLRATLQLYNVTNPTDVNSLLALARVARQRDWLAPYKEHFPAAFTAYLGLEMQASALYFWQPMVIPGIMQTDTYASAVIRTTAPEDMPEDQWQIIKRLRFERQRNLLNRPDAPLIDAVLDESVLHRVFGDPATMREQLLHVLALGTSPRIQLRILPFIAGVSTVSGPFIVLEFPDQSDADAVYLENAVAPSYVLDRADGITRHRQVFERLCSAALSPADSLAYIADFADRYN